MDRNICDIHGVKRFVRWPDGEDMSASLMQQRVTLTVLLRHYNKAHNAFEIMNIPNDASVGTLPLKNIERSKEELHGDMAPDATTKAPAPWWMITAH